MRSKQGPDETVSKSALNATAQVLAFLKTRLGYGDKEILDAAQKWGKKNQRKKHKQVTQLDMLEGVETIIQAQDAAKRRVHIR